MNASFPHFYVHSRRDTEGCCIFQREYCCLAPSRNRRIFMGSFYSGYHAFQYFRTHNPDSRAALCIECMRE